jgi:hypothetical protein
MGRRHALGCALLLIFLLAGALLAGERRARGAQTAAPSRLRGASAAALPASPATPLLSAGTLPERNATSPSPVAAGPQQNEDEPVDGERWLLSAMLARASPRPLSQADRVRMADLLLDARDLRGRETPSREREILLALSDEFERIAGEPMGNVASRLALPDELPARPPPGLAELPQTDSGARESR